MNWKTVIAFLVVACAAGAVAATPAGRHKAAVAWRSLTGPKTAAAAEPNDKPSEFRPPGPWDGLVTVDAAQQANLDLETTPVRPQTEPIELEINGTTAYDPGTLTQIRTRFSSLVKTVHVGLGSTVHKGDVLVELYSAELAEAKSVYEEKFAQWDHDNKQLQRQKSLLEQKAISEQAYFDTVNDELKSRTEFKLARDKLEVYGLTNEEILAVKSQSGAAKATMVLRSPTDGLVITRDVVQGNLYDVSTVLMVIAPLDHLWVKGNVYESDQHRLQLGLEWEIRFPYIVGRVVHAKVEHIDARVDPTTKTVQIRTSIPNPEGRLKADMLVGGVLHIPPRPGRTVVPRGAVVVNDTASYVFVLMSRSPDRYERRKIEIAKEYHDQVIVAEGLKSGEEVVRRGALILSQMYEDLAVTQSGEPL